MLLFWLCFHRTTSFNRVHIVIASDLCEELIFNFFETLLEFFGVGLFFGKFFGVVDDLLLADISLRVVQVLFSPELTVEDLCHSLLFVWREFGERLAQVHQADCAIGVTNRSQVLLNSD